MSQTIEVVIRPDGQLTIETKGMLGHQCRQASRFLEQALGQTATETLTLSFICPRHCHSTSASRRSKSSSCALELINPSEY